ncbi:MAG TPA: hypothetical protein VFM25_08205, partial [Verrucomicrobiae bacterium]|nr:hypothetical protein [Verrucomicrobiae bacterium]
SATDASVVGGVPGTFTFTRTGGASNALTIVYSLDGTARRGVDYEPQGGSTSGDQLVAIPSVTIPAGATSATVSITPVTTTNIVGSKTVVATVAPDSNYSVVSPGNATLTIAGNTVSKPSLTASPSGPTLSWASTNGASYRIAYKNNLSDPTWTFLPDTFNSTGAVTSWIDTEKLPQRFYQIIRIK